MKKNKIPHSTIRTVNRIGGSKDYGPSDEMVAVVKQAITTLGRGFGLMKNKQPVPPKLLESMKKAVVVLKHVGSGTQSRGDSEK
jgi:hypothetical protein